MKSWRSSVQVAGPPSWTPFAMGPTTSQISAQTCAPGAASDAGCLSVSMGRYPSLYRCSRSGPPQSNIGNRLPSTTPSIVLRLVGHCSTGPSFVLDQSVERMIAPISPPPANKSVGAPIVVFPQPDEPIGLGRASSRA
jgi:hypothetical protein